MCREEGRERYEGMGWEGEKVERGMMLQLRGREEWEGQGSCS